MATSFRGPSSFGKRAEIRSFPNPTLLGSEPGAVPEAQEEADSLSQRVFCRRGAPGALDSGAQESISEKLGRKDHDQHFWLPIIQARLPAPPPRPAEDGGTSRSEPFSCRHERPHGHRDVTINFRMCRSREF